MRSANSLVRFGIFVILTVLVSGVVHAGCDDDLTGASNQTIGTLEEARAFVRGLAQGLDPKSRYVTELVALIDGSRDLDMLKIRLGFSRGARWAGADAFEKMTLEEKLRSNLTTTETRLFRFYDHETWFFKQKLFGDIAKGGRRILSLPSANGLEAYSLASQFAEFGFGTVDIDAFDIQPAIIAEARTGVVGLANGGVAVFLHPIRTHLNFKVHDVFKDALKTDHYDAVVCRNFLPYFTPERVEVALTSLVAAVRPGGYLVVDSLSVEKFHAVFSKFPLIKIPGQSIFLRKR